MLFSEIVGNTDIKNRLVNTVLNNRVSHAQLFLGVEGTEKLAMAIAYSQFISCENKQIYGPDAELIADSCGTCPSCVKYQKLVHPDLHFVFPVATTKKYSSKPVSSMFLEEWREALKESNYYLTLNEWYEKIGIENKQGRIGVDDANNIIKTLGLRSYESDYKVMIIWMVEKLYHAAAPKLLKILEEPPAKTLFILISENQDALLKTILSRVQILKFKTHSDELIRDYLNRNFQLDEKRMEEIIYLSDGLFSKVLKQVAGDENELVFFKHFREMMLFAYQNNFIKMREKANELNSLGREKIKQLLQYGMRITRLCMLYDLGNRSLVRSANDELDFVSKFSRFVNQNNAGKIYELLSEAEYHVMRNVNPRIVLLDTMLQASLELRKQK
jgi:DNA polymerase-3 subunit delta'